MLSIYPACFFREEVGYSVIFPDLNFLSTCGDSLEEAMAMAVDCLAGYIYVCRRDGEKIPPPSAMQNVDLQAIGQDIYDGEEWNADASWVNLVAVDVAAYARDNFEVDVPKKTAEPF